MTPYLRKVMTASGATAVQVVVKENGARRIVEHLGSAHDKAGWPLCCTWDTRGFWRVSRSWVWGRRSTVEARHPVMSRVMVVRREGRRSSPAGRAV